MAVSLACFCEGHGSTPDVRLCCGAIVLSKPPPPAASPETGKGQGVSHGRSLTLWPRPTWMPALLSTLRSRVTIVTPAMTTRAKRKPWSLQQVLGPSPHMEHGNDGLGPGCGGGWSASQPWGLGPFKHTSLSLPGGHASTTPASRALGTPLTWSLLSTHYTWGSAGTKTGSLPLGSGPDKAHPPGRQTAS